MTLRERLEKVFRDAVALCDAERLTAASLVRDGDLLEIVGHRYTTAIGPRLVGLRPPDALSPGERPAPPDPLASGGPTPRLAAAGAKLGISLQGGRVAVIAAGKASPGMARAVGAALRDRIDRALLVPPADMELGDVPAGFEVVRGAHPIPDAGSIDAAKRALEIAESLGPDDMLLCAISGGASALLEAPWEGLSLADEMSVTRALLESGAEIGAINAVRKHLSRIKGGRLAAATKASVLGLLFSDVAGDPPDVIGSGPVSPDPTTFEEALRVLESAPAREAIPSAVLAHLAAGRAGQVPETPKPKDPLFDRARTVVIAGPEHLRACAVALAAREGFAGAGTEPPRAGQEVESLARHIADTARMAKEKRKAGAKPHAFVWVREPSVRVTGDGVGGRNGHLALLVARELAGVAGVSFLSAGSDGIDGTTRAAGAVVDGGTWNRALADGLDPAARLARFDSGPLHEKLGTAIVTGRTGTNFMDLQLLAVE